MHECCFQPLATIVYVDIKFNMTFLITMLKYISEDRQVSVPFCETAFVQENFSCVSLLSLHFKVENHFHTISNIIKTSQKPILYVSSDSSISDNEGKKDIIWLDY